MSWPPLIKTRAKRTTFDVLKLQTSLLPFFSFGQQTEPLLSSFSSRRYIRRLFVNYHSLVLFPPFRPPSSSTGSIQKGWVLIQTRTGTRISGLRQEVFIHVTGCVFSVIFVYSTEKLRSYSRFSIEMSNQYQSRWQSLGTKKRVSFSQRWHSLLTLKDCNFLLLSV